MRYNRAPAKYNRRGAAPQGHRVEVNNTDYTIKRSDRIVALTTTAFSAPRTLTIPLAKSLPAGFMIRVVDEKGAISPTNYMNMARSGSDLVNGATSVKVYNKYAQLRLTTDGVDKWSFPLPIEEGDVEMASATNMDLGLTRAQSIKITGTTNIDSFGSSAPVGAVKFVRHADALTVNYSANIITPAGVGFSTDASTSYVAVHTGSGVWRVFGLSSRDVTIDGELIVASSADIVGELLLESDLDLLGTLYLNADEGTAGQTLKSKGPAASPIWEMPLELIQTHTTTSGTTKSTTGLASRYRALYIEVDAVSFSAAVDLRLAVSADNGSSYGTAVSVSAALAAASGQINGAIWIHNLNGAYTTARGIGVSPYTFATTSGGFSTVAFPFPATSGNIDAIRFSGGTFDNGEIRVYGLC